jgi:hypothetical protein
VKFRNLFLVLGLLNVSLVTAENSSRSDQTNIASITQKEMLINRQASLRLKIDELEIIKNNTQNPFSYRRAINDLKQFYKEIEIIEKMQTLLANNSNNIQTSES